MSLWGIVEKNFDKVGNNGEFWGGFSTSYHTKHYDITRQNDLRWEAPTKS